MNASTDSEQELPLSPDVVARLVAGHRDFLAFLEARVPNRPLAEDILQSAFVRTLEKGGTIRQEESSVAWFYRVLRNALIDYYRHRSAEQRAHEAQTPEPELLAQPELKDAICGCMRTLLPTIKPEYAEILSRVDLQEQPVTEVASILGISANNAAVRLHRARRALKERLGQSCGTCATHGCLDCTCDAAPSCGSGQGQS